VIRIISRACQTREEFIIILDESDEESDDEDNTGEPPAGNIAADISHSMQQFIAAQLNNVSAGTGSDAEEEQEEQEECSSELFGSQEEHEENEEQKDEISEWLWGCPCAEPNWEVDYDPCVQCDVCGKWYHQECQKVDTLTLEGRDWLCTNCMTSVVNAARSAATCAKVSATLVDN
jgi:hypothetical protein